MSRRLVADLSGRRYDVRDAPPGTLHKPGPQEAGHPRVTRVTAICYGPNEAKECELTGPDIALPDDLANFPVKWINVDGLADPDVLAAIGRRFTLHPLALEDVLDLSHRPKAEEYEGHIFVVARELLVEDGQVKSEHVALFLGRGFVITLQERPGDLFEPIRERIRRDGTAIRVHGADYLAYLLIDAMVDGVFPVLELYGEQIETLEDLAAEKPSRKVLQEIHELRRELLALRRTVWPERDLIAALQRTDNTLITPATKIFLRDSYDHAVQIMDMVETYRELASNVMEVYVSTMGNRLNEIMKVLTVIATIFIPLSFIAGVYGMNFNTTASPLNMPELNLYWGYPLALGIMALTAGALLVYFYRRGWL